MTPRKFSLRTHGITLTLSCVLAALALTARPARAGWIEERDGKTIIHIKVHSVPDPANTDTANRAAVAGVRLFVQRFPEIFARKYRDKYKANPDKYGRFNWDHVEVALERFTGIQIEGVENDMLAIAGGMSPDVIYVNFRKSDQFIQEGFLYPLDKPEDGYFAGLSRDEIDLRVHPKLWPVIRRKGPDKQPHIWAMPYDGTLGKVLCFRKDLFDENNIPYPDNNWTWEQMYEAAKKITDPKRDRYGFMSGRGVYESWYWITFLWSAGGEIMRYDEATNSWRTTFDSREAAKALDFYLRLSAEPWVDATGVPRKGYTIKDATAAGVKWNEGKVGMQMAYIDEKLFQTINPDVTGMVPVPLGPPDEHGRRVRGAELNSRMMGLFSRIEHPAVRDAAWEYIEFYDSREAMAVKTKVMVEGGLGRFVNPKYLKMYGYEDLIRLSPRGWAQTFDIAIDTGQPEPYGRGSNLAYQLLTIPIQEAEQLYLDGRLPRDEEARLDVLQAMLTKANAKANEMMIGIITPRQMFWRRVVGWTALTAIVIAFGLVFRRIFKAFEPAKTTLGDRLGGAWNIRKYWLAYLLLVPAVGTIFMWGYLPLARGSLMSVQDYRLMGGSRFVAVDNFGALLFDPSWWEAVWNSIRYSLLVVSLTFLPPIALAILLQEIRVGTIVYRTLFYLPAVITGLVTMLLWKMFYEPSEFGTLNQVVMAIPAGAYLALGAALLWVAWAFAYRLMYHGSILPGILAGIAGVVLLLTCVSLARPMLMPEGETIWQNLARLMPYRHEGTWVIRLLATQLEPYRWLSDRSTAMLACVIPMVWAGMGPGCLIYLAALKGIAPDFYEAGDIDGATFIDKVLFIVFPILKPLVIINFVGVFIGSWQSSGNILVMTGGDSGTMVAELKIFYEAYMYLRMGPATAMAWVLGFMLIGFTVYQLRILSRLEFKTTGEKK